MPLSFLPKVSIRVRNQLAHLHSDQLVIAIPEHLRECFIDVLDLPVGCPSSHTDESRLLKPPPLGFVQCTSFRFIPLHSTNRQPQQKAAHCNIDKPLFRLQWPRAQAWSYCMEQIIRSDYPNSGPNHKCRRETGCA